MSAKFYICRHCGNLVGMIHDAGVPMMCCGQKMETLEPNTVEASGEKHLPAVTVEDGAELDFAVVMKNVKVGKGAKVQYAIVADNAIIEDGAVIGAAPEVYSNQEKWGIAVVGQGAIVKSGQVVLPGEMIEPNSGR